MPESETTLITFVPAQVYKSARRISYSKSLRGTLLKPRHRKLVLVLLYFHRVMIGLLLLFCACTTMGVAIDMIILDSLRLADSNTLHLTSGIQELCNVGLDRLSFSAFHEVILDASIGIFITISESARFSSAK